jgi:DNA-binding MarR family transcriptional regulator
MQDLEFLEKAYFDEKENSKPAETVVKSDVAESTESVTSDTVESVDDDTESDIPVADPTAADVQEAKDEGIYVQDISDPEEDSVDESDADLESKPMMDETTALVSRDAEQESTDALTMILEKEDSDVVMITDSLEEKGLTLRKLFAVRSGQGLMARTRLNGIRQWVDDKIKLDYAMNIKTAFLLLGKVGQLLRVSYAGCKGYNCQTPVAKVHSRYQNLIYNSQRVSSNFVRNAIRSIRYHYYASKRLENFQTSKAFKWVKRTALIADKMVKESEKMVKMAEALTTLSEQALLATTSDDVKNKKQIDEFIKKMKDMTAKMNGINAKLAEQKKAEEEATKDCAEALMLAKEWTAKHTKEANRQLKINTKCEPASADLDLGFVKFGYKAKTCHSEVDKNDASVKKVKLQTYEKQIQQARDDYLKVLMKKREIQMANADLYGEVAEILEQKDTNAGTQTNLQRAQKSLEISIKVMTMVKTIFLEALAFWIKLSEHAKALGSGGDDMKALEDLGMGDDFEFKEILVGSGFNWIAFGKIAKEAADAMIKVKADVTAQFVDLPEHAQVGLVLSTSKPIIEKVQEMIKDLRMDQKTTTKQIEEAEKAVKKEKEIEGVLEEDKDKKPEPAPKKRTCKTRWRRVCRFDRQIN